MGRWRNQDTGSDIKEGILLIAFSQASHRIATRIGGLCIIISLNLKYSCDVIMFKYLSFQLFGGFYL